MFARISGAQQIDAVTRSEVESLNRFVSDTRMRVIHAIDGNAIAAALAEPDASGQSAAAAGAETGPA